MTNIRFAGKVVAVYDKPTNTSIKHGDPCTDIKYQEISTKWVLLRYYNPSTVGRSITSIMLTSMYTNGI